MTPPAEPGRRWPAGGVHRVPAPAGAVAAELREAGWGAVVVPAARTSGELWDGLAVALELPGWFGRNLDALDEVLGDRMVPTALVLARWWVYARARPERWAMLLGLLRDRAEQARPPLVVVLAD